MKKIILLIGLCILMVGCTTNKEQAVREAVDDLVSDIKSIEVGEGNMSMSKGGEISYSYDSLTGIVTETQLSLPSPNGDIYMELINETLIRIFNENNDTIGYEDISDGNIYVESPTVTMEFIMACCKKLFGGYELIHKNSCPDSRIVEDSKCED